MNKKDFSLYRMRAFVESEFNKLITELKPEHKIELHIPSGLEYIKYVWDYSLSGNISDAETLVNIFNDDYLYDDAFMHSKYDSADGLCTYVIYVPEHHLLKLCYDHLYNDSNIDINEVYEYLSTCIRHEIGHLMYAQAVVKDMGYEKANIFLHNLGQNEIKEYWQFYSDERHKYECKDYATWDEEDEAYKNFIYKTMEKYYMLPEESQANHITNIDVPRFIEISYKVVYQYAEF